MYLNETLIELLMKHLNVSETAIANVMAEEALSSCETVFVSSFIVVVMLQAEHLSVYLHHK